MTENERILIEENERLRTRLSFAEERAHNAGQQYQTVAHDSRNQRAQIQALENELRRMQDKFEDEQDKVERLEERIRLMKRTSHDGAGYRQRYEDKAAEADALRRAVQDQDGVIRVQQAKIDSRDGLITKRNRQLLYMKEYLRGLGYVVDV
jgi:predicted RNase H-like nuclease (RuvC/YqgF family)